jgi:hypothetical protein
MTYSRDFPSANRFSNAALRDSSKSLQFQRLEEGEEEDLMRPPGVGRLERGQSAENWQTASMDYSRMEDTRAP